jgi:urease accessory protein
VTSHVAPTAADRVEPHGERVSADGAGAAGVTVEPSRAGSRVEPNRGLSAGGTGAAGVTVEPGGVGSRVESRVGLSADRVGTPAAGRAGLSATASVAADLEAGRPRIRWTQAWPIVLRPTGNARVHLVHGAGGPLGGDVLALDVRVGAGAALAVRSAGATIVQPGRGSAPARWDFDVVVGAGASLDWAPEPTVVTDGADFRTSLRIELGVGARASVREVVVLGRHGGVGGRYRGRFDVSVDGNPLLAHMTSLDGADPALCGPGGTAGARAAGTLVLVDTTRPTAGDAGSTTSGPTAGRPTAAAPTSAAPTSAAPTSAAPTSAEPTAGGSAAAEPTAGAPAAGEAVGAAAPLSAGPGADRGRAADGPAAVGERPGVRWAWTDLAGPGRALFAVGEPGAVIALLDAAAAAASRGCQPGRIAP